MPRTNRRNYYRVLHVQPDADAAVIRAAYRILTHKLRLHPGLDGDGASDTLIKEAYAVLSDPVRRAAYDAQINLRHPRAAAGPGTVDTTAPTSRRAPPKPLPWAGRGTDAEDTNCPFCSAQLPVTPRRPLRCAACASPLRPPPAVLQAGATRRAFDRQAVATAAEYFLRGEVAPRPATLADFSPRGAQMTTADAAPPGAILALKTPFFDAVARVVDCHPASAPAGQWMLRLEFMTLAVTALAGSLVSTRV